MTEFGFAPVTTNLALNMEPKYVPFDKDKCDSPAELQRKAVVEMANGHIRYFDGNALPKDFTAIDWDLRTHPYQPIITEDIPYEIVEPKKLPPCE